LWEKSPEVTSAYVERNEAVTWEPKQSFTEIADYYATH
jgi:hypothetical protein